MVGNTTHRKAVLDSDDIKWVKQQMDKIERQRSEGRDKYNTLDTSIAEEESYKSILDADLVILPRKGQLWTDYMIELKIHVQNSMRKNWKVHVITGTRGHPWFTHTRSGDDCFMCKDINMHYAMLSVMSMMAQQYPTNRF